MKQDFSSELRTMELVDDTPTPPRMGVGPWSSVLVNRKHGPPGAPGTRGGWDFQLGGPKDLKGQNRPKRSGVWV